LVAEVCSRAGRSSGAAKLLSKALPTAVERGLVADSFAVLGPGDSGQ
jgi:hypothetical protein